MWAGRLLFDTWVCQCLPVGSGLQVSSWGSGAFPCPSVRNKATNDLFVQFADSAASNFVGTTAGI